MTKFSFEVPIKHLNDFDDQQDFHFCLSMLFQHQEYELYHKAVRDKGLRTIWIDNSFNEKFVADDSHELLYLMQEMKAVRVVAPDSIEWTTEQIEDSWRGTAAHAGVKETIIVLRNYKMYNDLKHLDAGTIAVSYWKRPGMPTAEWTLNQLKEVSHQRRLHFLGLSSIQELIEVKPLSCDTSMPIKLALQHKTIKQWIEEGCPHINTKDLGLYGGDFFNYSMTQTQIALGKENIECLKTLIGDTTACVKF